MKIALITSSFLPKIGGAEFAVHHLARLWVEQGHQVCVFNSVTDTPALPEAGYEVRKFSLLRGGSRFGHHRALFSWYAVRQLQRLVEAYRPDCISAHYGYPVGIWLSRCSALPRYIVTCHGPALNESTFGPRYRFGISSLLADALNRAAGVIAISTDARRIMERIGVRPEAITCIPNGVDTRSFQKPVDFDLRSRFNLPPQSAVVLSVGREDPWGSKAYDDGIAAFSKVAAGVPDVYYVVLGAGTRVWLPLVRKLGMDDRVILCPGLYGDELIGAYQQADVFFSPSRKELCPLVVLEAMAAGLPEVVTNVSGSQDMITTGDNGVVVEPGDIDAMADALARLLGSETMRKRFGTSNRERSTDYDWGIISSRYLDCM